MNQSVNSTNSLNGSPNLPADKSISHRAVMFAALHDGESTISNFSTAADPHSTIECFRRLGVAIQEIDEDVIRIEGVGREGLKTPTRDLNCGNSGTTMRLLSGIIAGSGITATLTGDESLSARTMNRIIEPLSRMGANIEARDNDFAPLKISRNHPLKPLHFPLPIPSAQLKSCVLLAGLFGQEKTKVIETLPSRDHTERLLGLQIEEQGEKRTITASRADKIPEQSYEIPNDFSAAAFWLVAGCVHQESKIKLRNVGMNPTRTGALDILREMGANISIQNERKQGAEPVADLQVSTSSLDPIDITEEIVPNCIDEIPVLAIAMLFAEGTSRITGAEELRHKETDRLAAVADILSRAGAEFTEHEDGFEIEGKPGFIPSPARYKSFHDHRIAMSAAVLSLTGSSVSHIDNADCTAISYPSFWDDLKILTN